MHFHGKLELDKSKRLETISPPREIAINPSTLCSFCLGPANPSLLVKCDVLHPVGLGDHFAFPYCDTCWQNDKQFRCSECPEGTFLAPVASVSLRCGCCRKAALPDVDPEGVRCEQHGPPQCETPPDTSWRCLSECRNGSRSMCGKCTHQVFRFSVPAGDQKRYEEVCSKCVRAYDGMEVKHKGCVHCKERQSQPY